MRRRDQPHQKKGKKRMKQVGRIEAPQEAFLAVLGLGERLSPGTVTVVASTPAQRLRSTDR